jgi:4-amino-4-deoxy-L-arabinose transferase-like glycosyltransferase
VRIRGATVTRLRTDLAVGALAALGFVLRAGIGLWRGEQAFLEQGYWFYLDTARTFLAGAGLCMEPGTDCAVRMPLYPLLLVPFLSGGWLFPGVVLLQAVIGASLVWLTFAIGRELFGATPGLVAAALAAVNPYAVIHDTRLQDTAMFNALLALSLLLLIRAVKTSSRSLCLASGLALALATLTTARLALFVPFAIAGAAADPGLRASARVGRAALVTLPVLLLLGGWALRNWRVVGAPVLTTEAGVSLWVGNNATTFEFLPGRSIDPNEQRSIELLADHDRSRLDALEGREVERDRLFLEWGRQYIAAHPAEIAGNAARKIWAAVSGQLSPAREGLSQVGYAVFFVPIHLLAAIGLWRARQDAPMQRPVYLLLGAFAVTTAVFWAHTSHKSSIDSVLFVYAASTITRLGSYDRPEKQA